MAFSKAHRQPTEAGGMRPTGRRRGKHLAAVVTAAAAALSLAGGGAAKADTFGGYALDGNSALSLLGFTAPLEQPSGFNDPDFQELDLGGVRFAVIGNEYMGVVLGTSGTFGVSYDAGQLPFAGGAVTITHNVAGMLSFGNLSGNLRGTADNFEALNGFNVGNEVYAANRPLGYGVWPLPGYWQQSGTYDYSAYLRANVDGNLVNGTVQGGTNRNVGFNDGDLITTPVFRDNAMEAFYRLTDGEPVQGEGGAVTLRQRITLIRNTARIEWTLSNYDTSAAHRVFLRFAVNARGAAVPGVTMPRVGVFYQDPNQGGVTDRVSIFGLNPDGTPAVPVPDTLDVYGKRFSTDDPADPPFHSRMIFRGFGATLPSTVYVGDSEELFPLNGGFSPLTALQGRIPLFEDGLAVAAYYGPFDLRPGAINQVTVVTYYGNGSSTDRLDEDWAIATEAEEAFAYNSAAALDPEVVGNTNATYQTVGKKFLLPNPLTIYGNIYNRSVNAAPFGINLDDVRLSLVLPSGLQFGTDPATGQQDVATKLVGQLLPDSQATRTWNVEPTGDTFGTVVYQMSGTVGGLGISRAVSRGITIPATPLVPVTSSAYQMIGFPFQFDPILSNNGDPATIVNGLSRPEDSPVSFYRWIPDSEGDGLSGRYERATKLEPGVAYFHRPNLDRLLFLQGAQPVANQAPSGTTTPVKVQRVLERGWNMIANPFLYEIPINYLRFADTEGGNPITFSQAVSSGAVRGGVFFYNTQTRRYDFFEDLNQTLRPYQGYWIYLNDRRIIQYATPSQRQSVILGDPNTGTEPPTRKKPQVAGAIANGRALVAQPTMDNWKVQIQAVRADGNGDYATLVGVNGSAKDGDDIRDLPKPPMIVEDYVYVSVVREQDGKVTRLAQDLKAPGGAKSWELEVRADKDGPVTLSWPSTAKLPKLLRLRLTDKQTGKTVDLKSVSSMVVNVSKDQPSRFVLTADKRASQPLAVSNLRVERVRGTGSSSGRGPSGASYNFRFSVTADATVTGRITTLTGKVMNTFATGRAASSNGEVRLYWNGRSESGGALPAGPYQVEITAQTPNGESVVVKRAIQVLN
jgi:hypothetical protein